MSSAELVGGSLGLHLGDEPELLGLGDRRRGSTRTRSE
jgi:hypothetical protein